MNRTGIFAAVTALCAPAVTLAADQPPAPTEVQYRTRSGDTLSGLARRFLKQPADYRVVQALNHIHTPERLPSNLLLRVPVAMLRSVPARATIVSFSGAVTVNAATRARPGLALGEGTRLATGPNSFLTIRAADGSRVSMPSGSVLRITRLRRILLTGSLDQEFSVDRGRAQTSVMPQTHPDSHYRLRTPIAVSAVRGTVFRVAYGDGPSLTEVLGGHVAVGAPDAIDPVSVPAGVGAAVSASGAVTTETLLPPPALVAPDAILSDITASIALQPVDGAVRYRVQLARDDAFNTVFADAESRTPLVDLGDVPDGRFFARATAFSALRYEGLPGVYPVERRLHVVVGRVEPLPGRLHFSWSVRGNTPGYGRVQIFAKADDAKPIVDLQGSATPGVTVWNLAPGSYWWRIGSQWSLADQHPAWTQLTRVDVAAAR